MGRWAPTLVNTVAYGPEHRVNSGDLTVHDGQPVATHKDQCRHGGYAAFGFRNQGRCVAFVQRGPRP